MRVRRWGLTRNRLQGLRDISQGQTRGSAPTVVPVATCRGAPLCAPKGGRVQKSDAHPSAGAGVHQPPICDTMVAP